MKFCNDWMPCSLSAVLPTPKSPMLQGFMPAGLDRILRKLGEECTEAVVAAKNGEREKIVYETADLWFHSLVMLSHCGLSAADVLH